MSRERERELFTNETLIILVTSCPLEGKPQQFQNFTNIFGEAEILLSSRRPHQHLTLPWKCMWARHCFDEGGPGGVIVTGGRHWSDTLRIERDPRAVGRFDHAHQPDELDEQRGYVEGARLVDV